MRFVLAAAAVCAVIAAAAVPARSQVAAPGPQCGGSLWKLMTLSDTTKGAVQWSPTDTTLADISKLSAPAKAPATRTTSFQKKNWAVTGIIQSYRMASNGEIIFQLFDTNTSTYMDAYMPAATCLPTAARGRAQVLAARNSFIKDCGNPTKDWQPLGATVSVTGVGFWNPVKTTAGALKNGAELRPLTSLKNSQGCGHFG